MDKPYSHDSEVNIRPDRVMMTERDRGNIASGLDAITYEIERSSELLERLHHRISPVLNNLHEPTPGEDKFLSDDSVSDLQRELVNRAARIRQFNDGLSAIIGRIDL